MIVITREKTGIVLEHCHNPECVHNQSVVPTRLYYYDSRLDTPVCDLCKTELVGNRLLRNKVDRILFHIKGSL